MLLLPKFSRRNSHDELLSMLLPKFSRRNSHDELRGMARDAHYINFRTAAAPFTPHILAPLAQTVRQGSMRTILDFLEAWWWLITTAGFAEKLTKKC